MRPGRKPHFLGRFALLFDLSGKFLLMPFFIGENPLDRRKLLCKTSPEFLVHGL